MIKCPLFSTVNTVMFPTSSSMFIIARDFSIGSLKEAISKFDGELIVATQKEMSVAKPGFEGIFGTACLCKVENHIELPDRTIKFSVRGETRFQIQHISEEGNVIFGQGEIVQSPSETNLILVARREVLLEKLKALDLNMEEDDISFLTGLQSQISDEHFVMGAAHILKHHLIKHRELTLDEKNRGVMLLDVLSDAEKQKVNHGMAEMVKILESSNWEKSMQEMERALPTS